MSSTQVGIGEAIELVLWKTPYVNGAASVHAKILNEIRSLHQLGVAPMTGESVDSVLTAAAEAVSRLLPCDRVSLIELDTQRRQVGFFARGGKGSKNVITTVDYAELEQGLSGWVLQRAESALSPKNEPNSRESPLVQQRRSETNCGSIVVVPLQVGEQTLGTMTAINGLQDRDFTADDVELMEMFANFSAIVIQNARHFLELRLAHQEMQSLNQRLEKRNALKDNLFTILAHDLRGPVGNTALMIDLVKETMGVHGDLGEILESGGKAAHQTFNLLENLLKWVRSQLEGVEVLWVSVGIRELLEQVRAWLEPQSEKKSLRILVDCPGHLTVTTDLTTVETVLRNFLSNAIKYSPIDSQIQIRGKAKADEVIIEVEDFGVGIASEGLARLFGHVKVDSQSGTNGETGNGLGMMFCSDLASSVGGRLEAESRVGHGSVFRLILPNEIEGDLESAEP